VSHPAEVLIIRLSASEPALDAFLSFDCDLNHEVATSQHQISLGGRAPDHVEPNYSPVKPVVAYKNEKDSDSIRYAVSARIIYTDGTVCNEAYRLFVTGAREMVIAVAIHSNYAGYQIKRDNDKNTVLNASIATLDRIMGRSYDDLYEEHIKDYQSLYNRVSLSLSPHTTFQLPTSQRLAALSSKMDDPSLLALILNYARYLLISSSRQGTQPANLQGIWNPLVQPPWSSNYTANINVEMNYWIAESLNLPECHLPLIGLIDELAQSGAKTSKDYFGMGGWMAGHNTDLWRKSSLVSGTASYAYWPMAGLWLCQHLWQHYTFTQDELFLRNTALPLMTGAAQFLLDYMVEDAEGYMLTCPSTSPENNYFIPGINSDDAQMLKSISPRNRMAERKNITCAIDAFTTMDITMTRELFNHILEADKILGTESDFDTKINAVLSKLPPLKIGKYNQLQEWSEDFEECTPAM
ncbi:MAG: glycoside hydrolase family 95 protein, partial [Anaerolineales bacterium]